MKVCNWCPASYRQKELDGGGRKKKCIGNKNWMEVGNGKGEYSPPFIRIEKSMDNATLDVCSHPVIIYFKHKQIQGMLGSLLDENKKENVEEQFTESNGDCDVMEELSGVLVKGAKWQGGYCKSDNERDTRIFVK